VGAKCVTGLPAVPKGKDVGMALLYGKSPFYRKSILLWLSVGLAGLLLGGLHIAAQSTTKSSSQGGTTPTRSEAAAAIVAQEQSEVTSNSGPSQDSLSRKQRRELLKENLEKMKHDAGELAELTKALQDELNKANENVLALDVVDKADKIQKLAKKIKGNARGI